MLSLHDRAYRDYQKTDLLRMLLLGPFDLLLYRPILMWAGMRGTVEFLKKEKSWNKFERNARATDAATSRGLA